MEKLSPTANAQPCFNCGGGGGGSTVNPIITDELWSEPRNLIGSPGNRLIEPMRIGSVLPEGSNFEFAVPIIGSGGRGLGANLKLHYNSRVWTRRGSTGERGPSKTGRARDSR